MIKIKSSLLAVHSEWLIWNLTISHNILSAFFTLYLFLGVNLCEEWFDFELPFDIWWQHTNEKLSRKVDPPKFKKIRQSKQ